MVDLDRIAETLEARQESRDAILGVSRRVLGLCSRTIMSVHRGQISEALEMLGQARSYLEQMRATAHPQSLSYMIPAEQEYVEASALLAIVRDGDIPDCTELNVMPESYVLGLLDVVGELKRLMLDNIRAGLPESALRIFNTMDDLYGDLYVFAAYDKILKESRRKLDVCRMVLETSRSAITDEQRRREMTRPTPTAGFRRADCSAGDGI